MFSGIVQGMAELVEVLQREDFRTHRVRLAHELLQGLKPGASVAHNGCCLTVSAIQDDLVSFDLMRETLRLTNLGELQPGDRVNIERAARIGDEIGGHQMSGHILGTARVTEVRSDANNRQIWMRLPGEWMKYVFTKGFIGIDGISLTVGELRDAEFCVNLIPETLQRTNIGMRGVGDRLNIEVDPQTQAIVETVERVLQNR